MGTTRMIAVSVFSWLLKDTAYFPGVGSSPRAPAHNVGHLSVWDRQVPLTTGPPPTPSMGAHLECNSLCSHNYSSFPSYHCRVSLAVSRNSAVRAAPQQRVRPATVPSPQKAMCTRFYSSKDDFELVTTAQD